MKKLVPLISIAFTLTLNHNIQAQTAPVKQWDKNFGTISFDEFKEIKQTSDGGYILGGTTDADIDGDKTENSRGLTDYWVIKLDGAGNKLWDKSLGGNSNEYFSSLQQTSDGGYILGGWSASGISGDKTQTSKGFFDYWIIKLDASGNKLWDKTIGGTSFEELHIVLQTSDGGYILGGSSASGIGGDKTQVSPGNYDYWIVKLDANGNKVWDKTYGGSDEDMLRAIQQTADGGFILGGASLSGISGQKSQGSKGKIDFWVVKLNASGNKVWDKTFGGTEDDHLWTLQQTHDLNYIIGGTSASDIGVDKTDALIGIRDFWVLKIDTNGSKIWDKTIGGNQQEALYSLRQTSDNNFILAGWSDSNISGNKTENSKGDNDYWVVKINSSGNVIWDKTLGGSDTEFVNCVRQTSDGGFILGGQSFSMVSGDKTQNNLGGADYWIVKLGPQITGVKGEVTSAIDLYPNPTTGQLTIKLEKATSELYQLEVTNVLGQVLQQKTAVLSENADTQLDLSGYSKGVYFIRISNSKFSAVKKVVVE